MLAVPVVIDGTMRRSEERRVQDDKNLINEDGDPTTPFKLATGTKPSVSHFILEPRNFA